jgi:hypothetical protein
MKYNMKGETIMRRKLTFILGVIFLISCMTTLASAEVKMEFAANNDFGGVQGANGWMYEYSTDDGKTYKQMDVYDNGCWTAKKADGSGNEIWGICSANWNLISHDVILATTFYAPYSGVVTVGSANGIVAPSSADIEYRLTYNGTPIKDWETFPMGSTQWEYYKGLEPVEVTVGDKIRYEIRLAQTADSFKQCWHIPKVTYTTVYENEVSTVADMTKTSWNNATDFATTQASVGAWRYEYTKEDGSYALMSINDSQNMWFVPNAGGDVDWNMPWIQKNEKNIRSNSNAAISFIAPVSGKMKIRGTGGFDNNLILNVMVDDETVYTHSSGWFNETSIGEVNKGQTVRVVFTTPEESIRAWFSFDLFYETDTNAATFDVDSQKVVLGEMSDLQLTGWMKNDYIEDFSVQLENPAIGTVEKIDGVWKITGNEAGTTKAWIVDGKGNKVDEMEITVEEKQVIEVNKVNIVKEDGMAKAEAEIVKYEDTAYEPILFLASYDSEGTLKQVTKMNFEPLNDGTNSCLTESIAVEDGDVLSALLWDGNTMKPLYTKVLG